MEEMRRLNPCCCGSVTCSPTCGPLELAPKMSHSGVRPIYLDHAATTPLDARVLDAMLPYLRNRYGNASSVHGLGRMARGTVEECRERVAAHIGAEAAEIVFTSGGTEADNAALRGMLRDTSMGLVTSATEHEAILDTANFLATRGHEVIRLPPLENGAVSPSQVEEALSRRTGLVSLAYVNNETGALTRLAAVSKVCASRSVALHTDAVQAASVLDLDVESLGVDLLSLSGHKIFGPKGIGVLYVRRGLDFRPLILGGSQERKRRAGTENVAAIVGLAAAMDLVAKDRADVWARLGLLQRRLLERLRGALEDQFVVNTPVGIAAAPHILNIAFPPQAGTALDGEMLVLNLDLEGIMVSAGSACSSGALEPSHVLLSMGLPRETAAAAIRFSLGRDTTEEDLEAAVVCLARTVARMHGRRKW